MGCFLVTNCKWTSHAQREYFAYRFEKRNSFKNSDILLVIAAGHLFELNPSKRKIKYLLVAQPVSWICKFIMVSNRSILPFP